jgi:hypothetical protein
MTATVGRSFPSIERPESTSRIGPALTQEWMGGRAKKKYGCETMMNKRNLSFWELEYCVLGFSIYSFPCFSGLLVPSLFSVCSVLFLICLCVRRYVYTGHNYQLLTCCVGKVTTKTRRLQPIKHMSRPLLRGCGPSVGWAFCRLCVLALATLPCNAVVNFGTIDPCGNPKSPPPASTSPSLGMPLRYSPKDCPMC